MKERPVMPANELKPALTHSELCLKGLQEAGHVRNVSLDDGLQINRRGEVISVPDGEFLAAKQPGPIASNYSWGEY